MSKSFFTNTNKIFKDLSKHPTFTVPPKTYEQLYYDLKVPEGEVAIKLELINLKKKKEK